MTNEQEITAQIQLTWALVANARGVQLKRLLAKLDELRDERSRIENSRAYGRPV